MKLRVVNKKNKLKDEKMLCSWVQRVCHESLFTLFIIIGSTVDIIKHSLEPQAKDPTCFSMDSNMEFVIRSFITD